MDFVTMALQELQSQGVLVNREHGTLLRLSDGTHIVYKYSSRNLVDDPDTTDVVCLEPDSTEPKRLYCKHFKQSKLFFEYNEDIPANKGRSERAQARRAVFGINERNLVVMGVTGYSDLSKNYDQWGLEEGEYEDDAADMLAAGIQIIKHFFPELIIGLADGASFLGIDKATYRVATTLKLPILRHSCPNFLFYVLDLPEQVILVSETQADYSRAFVEGVKILFSIGGRLQAFMHDMFGVLQRGTPLVPVNLMPLICRGQSPATMYNGRIEDATAALVKLIHFPGHYAFANKLELRQWVMKRTLTTVAQVLPSSVTSNLWLREDSVQLSLSLNQVLMGSPL